LHDGQPVVAEAPAPDGVGKVEVNAEGKCYLCQSPCTGVHERFSDVLEDPALEARLETAESVPDPQARAVAVSEVVPELQAAEANANRLADLEAQIDKLPNTEEANRLRRAFEEWKKQFEPGAADASQQLDKVQREIEERTPEPGAAGEEPTIGELTAEQKATTIADERERLEANITRGSDAEESVLVDIRDGTVIREVETTCKLLGTQVEIQVEGEGLRIIDVLVEKPDGKVVALEIKSGDADRKPDQVRKDNAMAIAGGTVIRSRISKTWSAAERAVALGGDEGVVPLGPHGPIDTIVVKR
jgi:hypothetical protein